MISYNILAEGSEKENPMEQVTIWYLADNEHGEKISHAIKSMGLTINYIDSFDFSRANILREEINIFIFDIMHKNPGDILKVLAEEPRIQSFLKFVILSKKEIKEATKVSFNLLHLEFVARPLDTPEFLLLLEKSIIVERYREIMKFISKEAETRIETYEGMMNINRKNVFESEREKEAFAKILEYEKNLIKEQSKLNKAMRDFTIMRHEEAFELKSRIRAEEMLSDLRRREMIDANNIIHAQESVIDFSSYKLDETKKILDASEKVAELSRNEALTLHETLTKEREMNKSLSEEIDRLLKENENLKIRIQGSKL